MIKRDTVLNGLLLGFLFSILIVGGEAGAAAVSGNIGSLTGNSQSEGVSMITGDHSYQPDSRTVVTSVTGITPSRERGSLYVVAPNGTVLYEEHRYNVYDDVDPSPSGDDTISYVAAEKLSGTACKRVSTSPCTRNFIERLNFTTGQRERLYSDVTPYVVDSRWHDADRLNQTHYAIADLSQERLIIVNVQSNEITYEWQMDSEFSRETTGDRDPNDWAHLNDVEQLRNGTFMLSPRNHDQVIFVRPGSGLIESKTLGSDDNYDILYEQHNPDYLYGSDGQESVIVADSQNNRIVEYAHSNGNYTQSWVWSDSRLRWPRDADRLPNGNTLISDTSGQRVIEVTPRGEIVWGLRIKGTYDAERLTTGDESQGGPPMASINDSESRTDRPIIQYPPPLRLAINGLLFVSPPWVTVGVLFAGAFAVITGVTWVLWTVVIRYYPRK